MEIHSLNKENADFDHWLLVPNAEPISIKELIGDPPEPIDNIYIPVRDKNTREDGKVSELIFDRDYVVRRYGIVHRDDGMNGWYGEKDRIKDLKKYINSSYICLSQVEEENSI